jgi:hypothetical protein
LGAYQSDDGEQPKEEDSGDEADDGEEGEAGGAGNTKKKKKRKPHIFALGKQINYTCNLFVFHFIYTLEYLKWDKNPILNWNFY